jgi:hypothetical protein
VRGCGSRNRDSPSTANLVRPASRAGTSHLLLPSIVGVERVAFGHAKAKLECERIVAGSGIRWTILRATQFYPMIPGGLRTLARLPLCRSRRACGVRPVDPDDVAARLASLASGPPAGRVRNLARPQELTFADLVRRYLAATGRRRPVVSLWLPGTGGIRAGALLPAGPYDAGAVPGRTSSCQSSPSPGRDEPGGPPAEPYRPGGPRRGPGGQSAARRAGSAPCPGRSRSPARGRRSHPRRGIPEPLPHRPRWLDP